MSMGANIYRPTTRQANAAVTERDARKKLDTFFLMERSTRGGGGGGNGEQATRGQTANDVIFVPESRGGENAAGEEDDRGGFWKNWPRAAGLRDTMTSCTCAAEVVYPLICGLLASLLVLTWVSWAIVYMLSNDGHKAGEEASSSTSSSPPPLLVGNPSSCNESERALLAPAHTIEELILLLLNDTKTTTTTPPQTAEAAAAAASSAVGPEQEREEEEKGARGYIAPPSLEKLLVNGEMSIWLSTVRPKLRLANTVYKVKTNGKPVCGGTLFLHTIDVREKSGRAVVVR